MYLKYLKLKYFKKFISLLIYYSILRYLPGSYFPIIGPPSRKLRYLCCKHIFKFCGKNVNIERKANFASGLNLEIGNNSGIGINCTVPSNIKIGNDVMMGPNCFILNNNHIVNRTDIPMRGQGLAPRRQTIIEDDVWIGRQVIFTPGRTLSKGSIVAAGTVLCKDFPEYSIIGGNPSQLIKIRK